MGKVLKFVPGKNAVTLEDDVISEICRITPAIAAKWLQHNHLNRQVRARQVEKLALEMRHQRWMLTGETIVIANTEDVLDGQHRLLACVEAGKPFRTVVIYGISRESFKAMGQGIPRSGGDAVRLNYPDVSIHMAKLTGTAVQWAHKIQSGLTTKEAQRTLSNQEVLAYLQVQPELWRCVDIIQQYPKDQRLLPLTAGAALFHVFADKTREGYGAWDDADSFMEKFYTGENLKRGEAAYAARGILQRDTQRFVKMKGPDKVFMMVKAWNAFRAGKKEVSSNTIRRRADESFPKIR